MKMSHENKVFLTELEGMAIDNNFAEKVRDRYYEADFEERSELFAWMVCELMAKTNGLQAKTLLDLNTVEDY